MEIVQILKEFEVIVDVTKNSRQIGQIQTPTLVMICTGFTFSTSEAVSTPYACHAQMYAN